MIAETTKYPFNAVVFTSDEFEHTLPGPTPNETIWGKFALDLSTLIVPKNPCVVDYNHDDKEPIGYAHISIEENAITAEGALVSSSPNDRASQIAQTGREIPFGISPTLDLIAADRIEAPRGGTYNANGRTYAGPIYIYKNAVLLGISVCPYPTDGETSFTPLNTDARQTQFFSPKLLKWNRPIPLNGDDVKNNERKGTHMANNQPQNDPKGAQAPTDEPDKTERTVKNAELQEYIDLFGLERGVAYYQSGLTIEEASSEAYKDVSEENDKLKAELAELKAACNSGDAKSDNGNAKQEPKDAPSEKELRASIDSALKLIDDKLAKMSAEIQAQTRVANVVSLRGDERGLSPDKAGGKAGQDYKTAFKNAVKR